jgi:hypothetical protein
MHQQNLVVPPKRTKNSKNFHPYCAKRRFFEKGQKAVDLQQEIWYN